MTDYFHVAPAGSLAAGQTPALHAPAGLPSEQTTVLDSLFPDGVTHWGEAMLTNVSGAIMLGPDPLLGTGLARATGPGRELEISAQGRDAMAGSRNRVIELVFELIRRLEFPGKPSRMACVFAYRTLDEAREYRRNRRDPTTEEIWRVSCGQPDAVHVSDSRWLSSPFDALRFIYVARQYWSGQPFAWPAAIPPDNEAVIRVDAVSVVAMAEPVEP